MVDNFDEPLIDIVYTLCKKKREDFCLCIDESQDCGEAEILELYDLVRMAKTFESQVIFSSTSGRRWLSEKKMREEYGNITSFMVRMEILPFTIHEAKVFFKKLNANEEWHDKVLETAGTVPRMLKYFENVSSNRDFIDDERIMINILKTKLKELELEKLDITRINDENIAESIVWLQKAVENCALTEDDYRAYAHSYVAHEFLTFSVPNSKAKNWILETDEVISEGLDSSSTLFVTFPSLYAKLNKSFIGVIDDKGLRFAFLNGFYFERMVFMNPRLKKLSWEVAAVDILETKPDNLKFSEIVPAKSQENDHIADIYDLDRIYFLLPGHQAIDAVVKSKGDDGKDYLLLIQLSLSAYNQHKSKCIDINKKIERL